MGNVRSFFKLISTSSDLREGPRGSTTFSGLANATPGNVLAVNWNGVASCEHVLSHAMFITAVTGVQGQQTPSTIKIAAHTGHTNSAYQVLSSYTSKTATSFATANIWNGWYDEIWYD